MTEQTKQKKITSKLFKKYFPYFGTLIILLGAFRVCLYYYKFNLDIFPYLEFSEIITLFLGDIFYLILLFASFFFFLLSLGPITIVDKVENLIKDDKILNIIISKLNASAKKEKIINVISKILLLILICEILHILLHIPYFDLLLVFGLIWSTEQVIQQITENLKINYNNSEYPIFFKFSLVIVLVTLILFSRVTIEYDKVAKDKHYFGTVVISKDSTIVSDSTSYFIGKVRNFIIIHNQRQNTNIIIPTTEIKSIQIKEKQPLTFAFMQDWLKY